MAKAFGYGARASLVEAQERKNEHHHYDKADKIN
jgi:hypothetical protein